MSEAKTVIIETETIPQEIADLLSTREAQELFDDGKRFRWMIENLSRLWALGAAGIMIEFKPGAEKHKDAAKLRDLIDVYKVGEARVGVGGVKSLER